VDVPKLDRACRVVLSISGRWHAFDITVRVFGGASCGIHSPKTD